MARLILVVLLSGCAGLMEESGNDLDIELELVSTKDGECRAYVKAREVRTLSNKELDIEAAPTVGK